MSSRSLLHFAPARFLALTILLSGTAATRAQSVCLPAPRLLTTLPMGGQIGTTLEVTVTGDSIEGAESLYFSHPGITAQPATNAQGGIVPNRFQVTIGKEVAPGLHDARLMTRLGLTTSRAFTAGTRPEITAGKSRTTLESALALEPNTICNAVMTRRAVDHYAFQGIKGQRYVVDCAARGIDSKLDPVLIVADAQGRDLAVERRGGALDFTAPGDARYIIKVHGLTFDGGADCFYRLALQTAKAGELVPRLPATRDVQAFSWPPANLAEKAAGVEMEPNNDTAQAITLPCDISGSFFPAADVDTFEFQAKKGEVWWVEVASERLGRPTDPFALVQHVARDGDQEKLTDVAELSDIPSPIKPSSNGYSYDGPPYNAGSADILGKVEIKQDGLHRLQLRDLFGGTRKDPRNVYRLVIRQAQPDFALVAWALHMNLRNGDRNALSKPIALRGGGAMALEVAVVRRDGFNGEIQLGMENLPEGLHASGLKVPAGQTKGIVVVHADANAPRSLGSARLFGVAEIEGASVTRPCRLASMAWPVKDAWQEVPNPRLLADVPVSATGAELAPFTLAPKERKVWEGVVGQKLTIPLDHTRRDEFSPKTIKLKTFGAGFEKVPAFDLDLYADKSEVVLDLAALKAPPGDYLIAFYGSAVAKYSYFPEAVEEAQTVLKTAEAEAARLAAEVKTASAADKASVEKAAKAAAAAVAAAKKQVQAAERAAKPSDIVDIIVSEPIPIRVTAAKK